MRLIYSFICGYETTTHKIEYQLKTNNLITLNERECQVALLRIELNLNIPIKFQSDSFAVRKSNLTHFKL